MYRKSLLAVLISSSLLLGCDSETVVVEVEREVIVTPPPTVDTGAVVLTDLDTVYGYASENGGTTGGSGENRVEVVVCTGEQMIAALKNKDPQRPLTIWVNGTITLQNAKDSRIDIKDIRDVSIIGLGSQGEMAGIGFNIVRAQNIIIRNLRIHHVRANLGAPGDGISIEGPASNIWIDHNEIYNSLTVDDASLALDQVKDYYDGLVDAKGDARYITISFNKFHNSWKTSLVGSSDSDNYERTLTYHHNHWYNVNSRLPLFRFGKGHIYNNFYDGAVESGINSRMGAVIRIEQNHFANMKNPVMSMFSQEIGYWQMIDNIFENITWEPGAAGSVIANDNQSTGELLVPYDYQQSLIPVQQVKETVLRYAGVGKIETPPSPGLCPAPEPEVAVPEDPTPPPVPIDPVEPPANVDWNIYAADLEPFASNASDNYLQLGDAGNSSYKGDIDWVLWTDAGAYTPAMLKGLLPTGIGDISGYDN
ncbi:MAG: hypothetical protein B7Z18_07465 [Alishewanella sp. 32-51-5]|nr:MAG: hypothetical protein B7Z18_07465 [Alishewanella sp. 32-51-5]